MYGVPRRDVCIYGGFGVPIRPRHLHEFPVQLVYADILNGSLPLTLVRCICAYVGEFSFADVRGYVENVFRPLRLWYFDAATRSARGCFLYYELPKRPVMTTSRLQRFLGKVDKSLLARVLRLMAVKNWQKAEPFLLAMVDVDNDGL